MSWIHTPSTRYVPPQLINPEDFMAHVIALPCIGTKDTACVAVCPFDCIHPTKDAPDFAAATMLHIDPDTCTDCGLCVEECPVKAIFPHEDLPPEWSDFTARNAAYFRHP